MKFFAVVAVIVLSLVMSAEMIGSQQDTSKVCAGSTSQLDVVLGVRTAPGALVINLNAGSPAERLGLRICDFIAGFNGRGLRGYPNSTAFLAAMREAAMFSDADLQIWRKSQDGKTYDEDHLTARIPLQPESMLGISTSFQVLILDVVKNGAADLAGVRAGEFIDKVDGQSVTDMRSIFQLDQRIKAAADQQHEVLLTLARWSPIENPGAYKTTYETREILVKLTK